MRDFLTADSIGRPIIWLLFFASSVYGHVALKLAVKDGAASYSRAMIAAATSIWGWSAVAAWTLSCGLWVLAISRQKLIVANSISSFTYVMICGSSYVMLGERLTPSQWAGVGLIVAGIALVK